ncbi:group III truncated hemoglobin [Aureibaculum sp. 2210JD6-5]|uniref:group III truncated hemoglobin n=1 Tax=Aureibaculum sp. 2210JD6-5 TaxID=3103957 RepID=UPI002AAC6F61|nr:group III truncated hemoglobin [Aureibaculum sp. 2210JD6-5]MDY7395403.1 group III truncated hemoglobin [Aureibaculum sp. 2210JD6-5]
MQDIKNRKDIHFLISEFYKKLLSDDLVHHFFEDIIEQNHLEEHLEVITDFWNGILFNTTDYNRNAMQPHLDLNKKKPFKNEHFKRWLKHFTTSIDENFKGEKAEMAKTRALSIATIMEIKMINVK